MRCHYVTNRLYITRTSIKENVAEGILSQGLCCERKLISWPVFIVNGCYDDGFMTVPLNSSHGIF